MAKALRGQPITLYGGEQVLDFTFIDDTVAGILRAYAASLNGGGDLLGQEFHFVTGRGVSAADPAHMFGRVARCSPPGVQGPPNDLSFPRFLGESPRGPPLNARL